MEKLNLFSINRILVLVPNWIGDCLMITPMIRALRDNFPKSHIGILANKRVRDVFRNNPFINEVIEIKDSISFFDKIRLVKVLSLKRFDTALILKPSFTKSLICKLSRVKSIVGFKSKKFTFTGIRIEPLFKNSHKMDHYLYLLTGLGIKVDRITSEFFLSANDKEKARQILTSVKKGACLVVLHPKANWDLKMWPEEYFAELADKLIEKSGASVILTGTNDDLPLIKRIEHLMENKPYILAGRTSLGELAAVLKYADLFISADTGIMHLAAALKIPLIAVFGATSPYMNGPRGEGIIKILFKNKKCGLPCYNLDCKDNICMKEVKVDDVFRQAREIFNG